MAMTRERLLSLVDELIGWLLEATNDAAQVESTLRSLGLNDDELRSFGFDVSK